MSDTQSAPVSGDVSTGFDEVRDAFTENFTRRGELGGACCVYHRGRKVVDLWGGIRNEADWASHGDRTPWSSSTLRRRVWPPWR